MSLFTLLAAPAGADSLSIGVNIGTPPPPAPVMVPAPPVVMAPQPPMVLAAPPQIVAVPGTAVLHAPNVGFNLFVYGNHYYSFHNGAWFYAATHGGQWAHVKTERVPRAVLAVPVAYYKIPPGHAKKHGDWHEGPGHGRGPHHKKWKHD
jgi:hypothetical protein